MQVMNCLVHSGDTSYAAIADVRPKGSCQSQSDTYSGNSWNGYVYALHGRSKARHHPLAVVLVPYTCRGFRLKCSSQADMAIPSKPT
eukprot:3037962-Amphidinium_carterae.1